jgi:hypothetical protein
MGHAYGSITDTMKIMKTEKKNQKASHYIGEIPYIQYM